MIKKQLVRLIFFNLFFGKTIIKYHGLIVIQCVQVVKNITLHITCHWKTIDCNFLVVMGVCSIYLQTKQRIATSLHKIYVLLTALSFSTTTFIIQKQNKIIKHFLCMSVFKS